MKIAITCHYASLPEDHPTWKRAIEAAEVVLSEKVNLSKEELFRFCFRCRCIDFRNRFHQRRCDCRTSGLLKGNIKTCSRL